MASQLTQQQRLRQESIFELIFSEQCFRDDMKRVIEVYLEPLKKESILSPKELDKMFSNLTDLYDFSCVFSAALVKRQDEDNFVVNRVGNIIQQYVRPFIIILFITFMWSFNSRSLGRRNDYLRSIYPELQLRYAGLPGPAGVARRVCGIYCGEFS